MKKKISMLFMGALLFATLPGCKKVYDYINDNPGGDYTDCQVKEITLPDGTKGTFTYNKDGNPTSVIYPYTTSERPNFSFKYDNKKRLIESLEYYDNNVYRFWSKYKYNSQGLIISDSTYEAGMIENGVPVYSEGVTRLVRDYTYDSKNRIIKVSQYWPDSPGEGVGEVEWLYDANDNRQTDEPSDWVYDSKMNIHRTHKVFMFIDRDYSLNNPTGATTYNSNYLPTKFGSTIARLLGVSLENSTLKYKCK